jgi:hypothetical protein
MYEYYLHLAAKQRSCCRIRRLSEIVPVQFKSVLSIRYDIFRIRILLFSWFLIFLTYIFPLYSLLVSVLGFTL